MVCRVCVWIGGALAQTYCFIVLFIRPACLKCKIAAHLATRLYLMRSYLFPVLVSIFCGGCSVVAVADAAVTVVATTVKVGATVVGATVDVAAAGVKVVVGSSDEDK